MKEAVSFPENPETSQKSGVMRTRGTVEVRDRGEAGFI